MTVGERTFGGGLKNDEPAVDEEHLPVFGSCFDPCEDRHFFRAVPAYVMSMTEPRVIGDDVVKPEEPVVRPPYS